MEPMPPFQTLVTERPAAFHTSLSARETLKNPSVLAAVNSQEPMAFRSVWFGDDKFEKGQMQGWEASINS